MEGVRIVITTELICSSDGAKENSKGHGDRGVLYRAMEG